MRQKRIVLLSAALAILQVSPTAASDMLAPQTRSIVFPAPGRTIHATLTGDDRFDIAWRMESKDRISSLFVSADNTFYYMAAGKKAAILPSGEPALQHSSDSSFLVPIPAGISANENAVISSNTKHYWTYKPPEGEKLRLDTLQADLAGNLYIQDQHDGWYSLAADSGKLRYSLQLNLQDADEAIGPDLTCKAAPSGDAVCASPLLGIIGIRDQSAAPRVFIDGWEQFYAQKPFISRGTTLVPMRGIFEKLGAAVRWNAKDRSIQANKSGLTLRLAVGSIHATVNQKPLILAEAPVLSNGVTFVPLRFISESLGALVIWEKPTAAIQIVSSKSSA
ncbi:copper amine oxidase N-terminal domain-containing protein [Paenibacillus montanisoli]|uniref:Copper amine oxidase-like N-terminal domain-containing protein n=1 Tax=Paenibacillus montanisoli TaxID=2081970 RepID=A0A328TWP7_9BACL|nr:copper amine oxidase N-terminal domain-containing protein [Paenibacillus montanisoli]RAP73973.1 hypothetical protein DL346_23125 [Paenibacillus montanisoli]